MAALTCEICGGKLVGKPGGVFECDSCGMEYSTEWARAKIQEIRGTVQVEGTVEVTGTVKVEGGANKESLLKRGYLMLEDGDWKGADACFDQVLEIAPENAEAYLGKSCSNLKFHRLAEIQADVKQGWSPRFSWWERDSDLQRAIQFATPELVERIEAIKAEINSAYTSHVTRLAEIRRKNAPARKLISFAADSTGKSYIAGVKTDGSVLYEEFYHWEPSYKPENPRQELSSWRDVTALLGQLRGLKADHTVVEIGSPSPDDWTDVADMWDDGNRVILLKTDGTVVASGENEHGENDVSDWSGITAIAAGDGHTVGLKADGTVVAVGANEKRQCEVSGWTDIVAIDASDNCIAGLKADGTVVTTILPFDEKNSDTVAVAFPNTHSLDLVCLKADGSVVTTSDSLAPALSKWSHIAAVQCRDDVCVGLTSDGRVLASSPELQDLVKNWKLFGSLDTLEQERESAWRQIRKADAERARRREEERAKRQAQQEAELARRRAALTAERDALQAELAGLRGLFTGRRRREIEARLAAIGKDLEG